MTLNEFLVLARTAKRISVNQEFAAENIMPVTAFSIIKAHQSEAVILENLAPGTDQYSLIAYSPYASLKALGHEVTIQIESTTVTKNTNPMTALRQLLQNVACGEQGKDFVGNNIGFFSYDAVRFFKRIPDRHPKNNFPDLIFHCYRNTLYFNHVKKTLLISVIVAVGVDPSADYAKAAQEIAGIKTMLQNAQSESFYFQDEQITIPEPDTDVPDDAFKAMVNQAKEYIRRGDAFQIVLSRTFKVAFSADPLKIYSALRTSNPAPYLFYIPLEEGIIVGASPETLVNVRHGQVSAHPIAGTRPRLDQNQEQAIEKDFLSDQKEVAEHMMLVDLARNDIGKISEAGSVKVAELLKVQHYAKISHITSTVRGQLQPEYDALDALVASFPAGTLTGAPKIRAMEIIDELETTRRGLYGGAIFRLDHQGNLDSCIAIRMAVLHEKMALIRAGAGIVSDSDPELEAEETRHKARAMLDALVMAEIQS